VLGTAFGGGIALLGQVDDGAAAMALLGAGGGAGLAMGVHWTRDHDRGKDLEVGDRGPDQGPVLSLCTVNGGKTAAPAARLTVRFW
jgi:hypothetical protein